MKYKKRGKRKMRLYRSPKGGIETPMFKLTFSAVLVQDANGTIDMALHYRSLTRFFTKGTQTSGLQNAPKVKDLWDEFRPVSTTVSWDPVFNTGNAANSGYVGTGTPIQFLFGMDRDNTGIGAPQTALTQKGTQIKNTNQKFKRYFKHGKYAVTSTSLGYSNVQDELTPDYQKGIIYFSSINKADPTQPGLEMGLLKVVHVVQFKGRTDSHPTSYWGVDDNGNPLLAQPYYAPPIAMDGVEVQPTFSTIQAF